MIIIEWIDNSNPCNYQKISNSSNLYLYVRQAQFNLLQSIVSGLVLLILIECDFLLFLYQEAMANQMQLCLLLIRPYCKYLTCRYKQHSMSYYWSTDPNRRSYSCSHHLLCRVWISFVLIYELWEIKALYCYVLTFYQIFHILLKSQFISYNSSVLFSC